MLIRLFPTKRRPGDQQWYTEFAGEEGQRVLKGFNLFESMLKDMETEKLQAVVSQSPNLLRHHCAHLVCRYVDKHSLSVYDWLKVLSLCEVDPDSIMNDDGCHNVLLLPDNTLIRLYQNIPIWHQALVVQREARASGGF